MPDLAFSRLQQILAQLAAPHAAHCALTPQDFQPDPATACSRNPVIKDHGNATERRRM